MAFPTIDAATATAEAQATTRSMSVPSVSGKSLLALFTTTGGKTPVTSSTGWVKLGQQIGGSNTVTGAIFYKLSSTGSDPLAITWDGTSIYSGGLILTLSNLASAPTATSFAASGVNTDCPSHTAPSSGDRLWLAARLAFGSTPASAAPTNYTFHGTKQTGSSSGVSTEFAYRNLVATTEDPGAFTNGINTVSAWTISLLGGAGVSTPTNQFFHALQT